eukprot:Gb_31644 [translate_table: standard]
MLFQKAHGSEQRIASMSLKYLLVEKLVSIDLAAPAYTCTSGNFRTYGGLLVLLRLMKESLLLDDVHEKRAEKEIGRKDGRSASVGNTKNIFLYIFVGDDGQTVVKRRSVGASVEAEACQVVSMSIGRQYLRENLGLDFISVTGDFLNELQGFVVLLSGYVFHCELLPAQAACEDDNTDKRPPETLK